MQLGNRTPATHSILLQLKLRHRVFVLLALCLLAYFRTVGVPFLYDDFAYVVNNPLIRDLGNYFHHIPAPANVLEDTCNNFRLRPLSYLSFTINHLVHGSSPAGYHAVNIAIHAANVILVYLLVTGMFTLSMTRRGLTCSCSDEARFIRAAFFTAALFAVHPVMTNAVTYITQRMSSLATFFYLLALVSYSRYLLPPSSGRAPRHLFYGLALGSCCAAMLTKEIAFTLPVMLFLFDLSFSHAPIRPRLVRLAPFLATMGIIPYLVHGLRHSETVQSGSKVVSAINLVNFTGISSSDYFVTQLKVIVFYLRLMFFPYGLSLEHHFPLATSLMEPGILGAMLVHALAIGYAGYLLLRFRKGSSARDIMRHASGCGIVWFYLTLSVESSFIPITEPAVEHRLYLPAAGFLLLFVCMTSVFFDTYMPRIATVLGQWTLTAVMVVLLGLTFARNEVWRNPEIFWQQTISRYPFLGRPYANLADYYLERKRPEEAIRVYQQAVGLIPDLAVLRYELGTILLQTGQYEQAVRELSLAISLAPKKETYYSLAKAKCYLGRFDEAQQILREAEAVTQGGNTTGDRLEGYRE